MLRPDPYTSSGFLKKADRIPEGEIERAERIMQNIIETKVPGAKFSIYNNKSNSWIEL